MFLVKQKIKARNNNIMSSPQELPINSLQEQLALDDSQLAIMGIARSMAATEKEISSAERSITFNRNYRPSNPGPRPHPEAGGMDHQDWGVASYEYAHADEDGEESIGYAEGSLREAEDKLYDLHEDKELIESGDDTVASKYATTERERIQAQIEKQRRAQEGADRHATYLKGAEIEGATDLSTAIKDLATDSKLGDVRGKVSTSGWKFVGTPYHGSRPMFERMIPAAANEKVTSHWKFNKTELLTLGVSDEAVSVEYTEASDIDEEAVKRYRDDLATVDAYSFKIKADGYVAEQSHTTGKKSTHLPNHMDDGTINGCARYGSNDPNVSLDAVLNANDITKMSNKIAEVTAAMQELAAQNQ
jgi:hypothetical protein